MVLDLVAIVKSVWKIICAFDVGEMQSQAMWLAVCVNLVLKLKKIGANVLVVSTMVCDMLIIPVRT